MIGATCRGINRAKFNEVAKGERSRSIASCETHTVKKLNRNETGFGQPCTHRRTTLTYVIKKSATMPHYCYQCVCILSNAGYICARTGVNNPRHATQFTHQGTRFWATNTSVEINATTTIASSISRVHVRQLFTVDVLYVLRVRERPKRELFIRFDSFAGIFKRQAANGKRSSPGFPVSWMMVVSVTELEVTYRMSMRTWRPLTLYIRLAACKHRCRNVKLPDWDAWRDREVHCISICISISIRSHRCLILIVQTVQTNHLYGATNSGALKSVVLMFMSAVWSRSECVCNMYDAIATTFVAQRYDDLAGVRCCCRGTSPRRLGASASRNIKPVSRVKNQNKTMQFPV